MFPTEIKDLPQTSLFLTITLSKYKLCTFRGGKKTLKVKLIKMFEKEK